MKCEYLLRHVPLTTRLIKSDRSGTLAKTKTINREGNAPHKALLIFGVLFNRLKD